MAPPVPCSFFTKGMCRKGDSCSFTHVAAAVDNAAKVTPVCLFYRDTGKCRQGDHCRFSHNVKTESSKSATNGKPDTTANTRIGDEKNKKQLCSFFSQGKCRNGDACSFMHSKTAKASEPSSKTAGMIVSSYFTLYLLLSLLPVQTLTVRFVSVLEFYKKLC